MFNAILYMPLQTAQLDFTVVWVNQNFVKMAVFHKLGTSTGSPYGLKSILFLDFRARF